MMPNSRDTDQHIVKVDSKVIDITVVPRYNKPNHRDFMLTPEAERIIYPRVKYPYITKVASS